MTHHTCEACHGVSETPGVCQTEGCSKKGQPLAACEGEHCEHHEHEELENVPEHETLEPETDQ